MTLIEFLPYHNRHIRFQLKDGKVLTGVCNEPGDQYKNNKPETMYEYIASNNMIEWKKAEEAKDQEKMKSLESEVDIAKIEWVEFI